MSSARYARRLLVAGALAIGGPYVYLNMVADDEARFQWASNVGPALRTLLSAEDAHRLGLWAAKYGFLPRDNRPDPPSLKTKVWGLEFSNPIGLAAGFDKDGEIAAPMFGLGFGFMEVGSVTPEPQPGNPKPRAFRLPELKAIINRYGFNSLGADAVDENLTQYQKWSRTHPHDRKGVLFINLGKNKTSIDAAQDYCVGLTKLGRHADVVVINISSPNTPGLRALQKKNDLEALVKQVKGTRDRMIWGKKGPPPLLIKVAPDLSAQEKADIAELALRMGLDGIIVSNTTIQRPGKAAEHPMAKEAGGLSGPPLMDLATECLSDFYRLTGGRITLVGCGGVSSGKDAYRKIRAGASLVELYTALAYDGPVLIPHMKRELDICLAQDGFNKVTEAIGADHKQFLLEQQTQKNQKRGWFW